MAYNWWVIKLVMEWNFRIADGAAQDWQKANFSFYLSLDNDKNRTSNVAFLIDWAQMSDLDFGLIQQNISIKKASFHY